MNKTSLVAKRNAIREPLLGVPGFFWAGFACGIKPDGAADFAVAHALKPCAAAAVFTRHHFPGAPILVGREHLSDGTIQTVVVNAGNANVATGAAGLSAARRTCVWAAQALGLEGSATAAATQLVFPSSTGVIGVPLPLDRIQAACQRIPKEIGPGRTHLEDFARAILTTDTRPKAISLRIGDVTLSAVAKGSGMIAPHMATMLAFFFTDAELSPHALQTMLQDTTARSFNCISVDGDTSTSDTALILANGLAGPVPRQSFSAALEEAASYLAREIARDGEGAQKLIQLRVCGAPSEAAAQAIARSIIDSPLIKTAIHGADPNWGRFVMAVGKVFEHPVPLEGLRVRFGDVALGLEIAPGRADPNLIAAMARYLREEDEPQITVALGCGTHEANLWGCDLSREYVAINAEYTS